MKKVIAIALSIIFLASCSTSNDVVSNKLFQKRKYKKGWHINKSSRIDKSTKVKSEEIAVNTESGNTESTEADSKPVKEETITQSYSQPSSVSSENSGASANDENNEEVIKSNERIVEEENLASESSTETLIQVREENSLIENQEVGNIKNIESTSSSSSDIDATFILLLILCFILPPITVGILRGWSSTEFIINLVLFLLAIGLLSFLTIGTYIAGVLAVVHALLILFDVL